jgi:WD40 repeat protein
VHVLSPPRAAPPLHDLLGVSFEFNSVTQALVWDRDFACFGLADGAVAILRAHWQGAPDLAPRQGGGIEIVPAAGPPAPPAIFALHRGGVKALAADPLGGIISGGADGFLLRLADGEVQPLEKLPRREIAVVAAGRGARRGYAAGRHVDFKGPDGKRLTMPSAVTALAYDPAGLHLAVGHQTGVSLEACGVRDNPRHDFGAPVTALAWRADGAAIAAASSAGVAVRDRAAKNWVRFENLPGAVTSLGFLPDGALVAAGADFVFVHHQDSGLARDRGTLRGPISCHPRFQIFAATDEQGCIWLRGAGATDAILLREPGPTITHLAFAPDGQALAFAAADGEAGTVILPDLLFRPGAIAGAPGSVAA